MKAPIVAVLLSLASSAPVLAGTFVYVSNAEDGDIGMYTLQADGSLQPGQRFKATKLVMPMAVSPDKRFLIAAVRSKPYQAYTYSIDKSSGALNLVGTGTLAESYPYIALDRSGRFLLGASYGANQVGVNPVGADGRVGEPLQVIPTARNAHSIRTDNTNRFVFVPHLGTDQCSSSSSTKRADGSSRTRRQSCSSSKAQGRATSSFPPTTASSICSTS